MQSLDSSSSVQRVLARSLAAAGGDAWHGARTLRLVGEVAVGGLAGPFEQWVDLAGGRMSIAMTLGPARLGMGFDGTQGWQRGANGEVLLQDAEAGRRMAVTDAWLNARGWWFAQRRPAVIESLGRREADGHAFDVLRAEPVGGQPAELWFDASTHRLARTVHDALGKPSVRRIEDWRVVDDLLLPMRWRSGSGDPRFDRVTSIALAQVDAEPPQGIFDAPAQRYSDVAFLHGGRQATLPFELVNNHVFVAVRLDGHPLRFILDTGGVNLVSAATAARIGLQGQGALEARGPGAASVGSGFARVERLEIGGVVALARQLLRVLDLGALASVEDGPVDGILGVELFKRLAVQIDYPRRELLLADPEDFAPPAGAQSLPISFFGHFPGVAADIDGAAGQFWLDTGNRGGVILMAPFVAAHGLAQRYAASAPATIGWGIGGSASGRFARGGCLNLGGLRVAGLVLRLAQAQDGVHATRHVAGNIGGEVLSRFVVAFDYARRRVHLAPGADADAPFAADRSGMWINRAADGFAVAAVMAGSPAQEAGLEAGDVIEAVDAVPAGEMALEALRLRLADVAVEGVRLRVRRGRTTRDQVLRLRDLIPAVGADQRAV